MYVIFHSEMPNTLWNDYAIFYHNVVIAYLLYLSNLWFLWTSDAERKKKEEEERLRKLEEIAEKQRQRERELEEKEKQRREALLGRAAAEPAPPARPLESGSAAPAAAAAAAAAPTPGKYVPKFRRERTESAGAAPPPETDRWNSSSRPDGDRWRSDDRRTAFGSGGGSRSSSTWSSSRNARWTFCGLIYCWRLFGSSLCTEFLNLLSF